MSSAEERRRDPDPAPTKHADAERVSSDPDGQASHSEEEAAREIENDPAPGPEERPPRDVEGG